MLRNLSTLALVAVHMLTWTAGPSYLCIGADGAVGIDGGPGACNRCAHSDERHCDELHSDEPHCDDADHAAHGHAHITAPAVAPHSHRHAAEPANHAAFTTAGSCDCTHQQLADAPAASSRSLGVLCEFAHVDIAAIPSAAIVPQLLVRTDAAEHSRRLIPPAALEHLSSTMLRC